MFNIYDFIIAFSILAIAVLLLLFQHGKTTKSGIPYIYISCGDNIVSDLLSNEREYKLKNNGYNITVEVKNKKIRVVESDCPNGDCAASPALTDGNGCIVCVPAKLLVRIIYKGESNADIIAG